MQKQPGSWREMVYVLGQRVIGVCREALQKPFLLCGLCVLGEDFDLERQKVSKR